MNYLSTVLLAILLLGWHPSQIVGIQPPLRRASFTTKFREKGGSPNVGV